LEELVTPVATMVAKAVDRIGRENSRNRIGRKLHVSIEYRLRYFYEKVGDLRFHGKSFLKYWFK